MGDFGLSSAIVIPKNATITIIGNGVVLDASFQASFFQILDSSLVMSNISLTNAKYQDMAPGAAYGGAMYIGSGGNVELQECTFDSNQASNYGGGAGGGMYIFGGQAFLTNCTFTQNHAGAAFGGAIYLGGAGIAKMVGCTFAGNTAGHEAYGGALYVYDGHAELNGCTFDSNVATDYQGGAIFISTGGVGATVLLKGCTFVGPVSVNNNDITRRDQTSNVIFACADGTTGAPVKMSALEQTTIPPTGLECN